jgi:hypothetical protein
MAHLLALFSSDQSADLLATYYSSPSHISNLFLLFQYTLVQNNKQQLLSIQYGIDALTNASKLTCRILRQFLENIKVEANEERQSLMRGICQQFAEFVPGILSILYDQENCSTSFSIALQSTLLVYCVLLRDCLLNGKLRSPPKSVYDSHSNTDVNAHGEVWITENKDICINFFLTIFKSLTMHNKISQYPVLVECILKCFVALQLATLLSVPSLYKDLMENDCHRSLQQFLVQHLHAVVDNPSSSFHESHLNTITMLLTPIVVFSPEQISQSACRLALAYSIQNQLTSNANNRTTLFNRLKHLPTVYTRVHLEDIILNELNLSLKVQAFEGLRMGITDIIGVLQSHGSKHVALSSLCIPYLQSIIESVLRETCNNRPASLQTAIDQCIQQLQAVPGWKLPLHWPNLLGKSNNSSAKPVELVDLYMDELAAREFQAEIDAESKKSEEDPWHFLKKRKRTPDEEAELQIPKMMKTTIVSKDKDEAIWKQQMQEMRKANEELRRQRQLQQQQTISTNSSSSSANSTFNMKSRTSFLDTEDSRPTKYASGTVSKTEEEQYHHTVLLDVRRKQGNSTSSSNTNTDDNNSINSSSSTNMVDEESRKRSLFMQQLDQLYNMSSTGSLCSNVTADSLVSSSVDPICIEILKLRMDQVLLQAEEEEKQMKTQSNNQSNSNGNNSNSNGSSKSSASSKSISSANNHDKNVSIDNNTTNAATIAKKSNSKDSVQYALPMSFVDEHKYIAAYQPLLIEEFKAALVSYILNTNPVDVIESLGSSTSNSSSTSTRGREFETIELRCDTILQRQGESQLMEAEVHRVYNNSDTSTNSSTTRSSSADLVKDELVLIIKKELPPGKHIHIYIMNESCIH